VNFPFFHRKEKFLVVGVAPQRTTGLLLSLDEDRNLKPEKFWEDFSFKMLGSKPLQALRKKKLIVAADPAFVTTLSFPSEFEREESDYDRPVSAPELERLISQAIDKEFHRYRSEAGRCLDSDELDAVLVGARAANFKVDGHKVSSPIGFRGKTLGAVVELTFTNRAIFDDFKDFFNSRGGFHFTGIAEAGLRMLSLVGKHPINLLAISRDGSRAFTLDKSAWGESVRRRSLDWSFASLFEAIAGAVPVNRDTVVNFYYDRINNDVSENFARALGRVMKPVCDRFFSELKRSRLAGPVYVHSPVPLPFSLPHARGRTRLEELPIEKIIEKLGFAARLSEWQMPASDVFAHLAPFLDFYYDKSNSEINRRLNRRLHWLAE